VASLLGLACCCACFWFYRKVRRRAGYPSGQTSKDIAAAARAATTEFDLELNDAALAAAGLDEQFTFGESNGTNRTPPAWGSRPFEVNFDRFDMEA